MKVLVACEFSGRIRESFREKGHDAWSCDLIPIEVWNDLERIGELLEQWQNSGDSIKW